MTYDPAQLTAIDRIRFRLLDTTNDPATEYLSDAEYQAVIDRHTSEARAGAELASVIAAMIAAKPVAIGSEGDSIRWSEKRAEYIKSVQADYLAEAEAEEAANAYGGVVTITSDVMTGGSLTEEW